MKLGKIENGIRVIGICELLELFYGEDAYKWDGPSYQETSKKVREWLAEHDAHFYAEEKHKFSVFSAIHGAKEAGKTIVVMENLS